MKKLIAFGCGLVVAGRVFADVQSPLVTTLPASGMLNDTAMLNGTVNPEGTNTIGWFEWSSNLGYGNSTSPQGVGGDTNVVAVSAALTGLTPGLIYRYRCVASNSLGVVRGTNQMFWTPALTLTGPNPMTNQCHVPFVDPTTANASPLAITAGQYHNLVLKANGKVVGWGWNDYGQRTIPDNATNVAAIAAGYGHSLALKADGSVIGWGANTDGQITTPASATNVVAIAAGSVHSLALKADGSVVGWGENGAGQTTIPADVTNVVAIAAGLMYDMALKADGSVIGWGSWGNPPASATNVVAIAAGTYHRLALKADGSVVGWGLNGSGQITIPASATNVVAIAAGQAHSIALKADGSVVGWGWNGAGQTIIPASATNVVAIAAGYNDSLALKADGSVVGWGANDYGQITIPAGLSNLNLPIAVSGTVDVDSPGTYLLTYSVTNVLGAVASTNLTVVVLMSPLVNTQPASNLLGGTATLNGSVIPWEADTTAWFEWGSSHAYGNSTPPQSVGNGTNMVAVNATLTGLTQGVIYHYRCVASNSFGVGRGADRVFWSPALTLNSPNPMTNECHVPFVDPTTANASPLAIAGGRSHSLAIKADGSVVGWGFGQNNIPANATNVVAIATGYDHSLALKADGSVVGWGWNFDGQTTIPASATNVVAIAAGKYHSLALKADSTVVGWGYSNSGQTTISDSAINVVAIAAGYGHSLALKADGSVVDWGFSGSGQITIPASATNVVAIAAGANHSLALKADGAVVGWGWNDYGQINIPAGATNVMAIAAGYGHSLALKSDGTVVGWGTNDYGQISIPASATNVVAIAAGQYHSLALKADGSVVGWGSNIYGETTTPNSAYQLNLPIAVTGTVDVNTSGTYPLSYSTTNALGAVATTTRTVIVADTLPPVLTLLGDNPLMHELGAPFADPGATATDLCAGDRTGSIFVWGTVNTNVADSYSLLYIVTDTSGNLAVTDRTVVVVTRPVLTSLAQLGNGAFHFTFSNTPGARFSVLASTNVALPSSEWTVLGPVTEESPGVFQFTDANATNYPACFYQLKWP